MVRVKKEFSKLFKRAKKKGATPIPQSKLRRLSGYVRRFKKFTVARNRRMKKSFLIYLV